MDDFTSYEPTRRRTRIDTRQRAKPVNTPASISRLSPCQRRALIYLLSADELSDQKGRRFDEMNHMILANTMRALVREGLVSVWRHADARTGDLAQLTFRGRRCAASALVLETGRSRR